MLTKIIIDKIIKSSGAYYKEYAPPLLTFIILFLFYYNFFHLPDPTYGDESILLNGAYRILQGSII